MPKITGLNELQKKLKRRREEARNCNRSSVVGYTQSYGIYVHEDLTAQHAEGKQAKYLEAPARNLGGVLGGIIETVYRKTKNMPKALMVAALRLQRESQEIVPIDTGALRASAFSAMDVDEDKEAAAARARSDAIRSAMSLKRTK